MSDLQDLLTENSKKIRGKIIFDAPLAKYTWFKVGGKADVFFSPIDTDDLAGFLKIIPENIPVLTIGIGSNMLIRDGGVRGVVIRLGRKFSGVTTSGLTLTAGTATPDITVSQKARDAEITGLEFYRGIPGTIGGALKMNAGAYGSDTSQVLQSAVAVDRQGNIHRLSLEDMGYSYRHSSCADDLIFTEATFKGEQGQKPEIAERMKKIATAREESQPIREKTGGSTFKNPKGLASWKLIDQAGCRGLKIGGAQMSEKHCNFMINTGDATAADLEELGETVRSRVLAGSGISLEWEIKRIGEK